MAGTIEGSRRLGAAVGLLAAVLIALGAGQARAAVYPAGGSSFTGGPEGWTVSAASCNVAVLCTAEGGYDASEGNPAGSLTAKSNVTINLASVFKATVTELSPEFSASTGGPATLHLDRQFVPADLVGLESEVTYTAKLIDRTAGTESAPLVEKVKGASGWSGVDAATSLVAGSEAAIVACSAALTRLPSFPLTVSPGWRISKAIWEAMEMVPDG